MQGETLPAQHVDSPDEEQTPTDRVASGGGAIDNMEQAALQNPVTEPSSLLHLPGAEPVSEDLLQIKTRHKLMEASPPSSPRNVPSGVQKRTLEDPADGAEIDAKTKKRMKTKIRAGDVSSSRIVFDQDGQALNPLEALAADTGRYDAHLADQECVSVWKEYFASPGLVG